ncbi:3-dehydroquinate synthase II [Alteribacillus persepolensis]|uniref:3-dehydroquinate synthase II n=2 Tax=Alteribacillus persepolensis TaxID=568899 RepID=A0A1G8C5Q2_9BACI|nr:3-dehydroquinate synthase II [Alteribacillus persepolensis]SDH40722.1 3-dehydroquinate synthase II [Alteribacillus persepolensis]
MKEEREQETTLQLGVVQKVVPIGIGTRVCIDTADILTPTEGVLVGNTGHGYMLVLSENRSTDTYPPRPFRINAGGIHQYIYLRGKTSYLSEMRGGGTLYVYNGTHVKEVPIGRVKMEKRELVRVEMETDGVHISSTLQYADSVSFLEKDGTIVSVKELSEGTEIYCCIDEPGRHLGEKIKEEIREY